MFRTMRVAAVVLLAVIALPGVAHAATALPADQSVKGSGRQEFTFTTSKPYWSVVAVMPPYQKDYDLTVTGGGRTAKSTLVASYIDFVAIDGNRLSNTSYTATVAPFNGATGTYTVQYSNIGKTLPDPDSWDFSGGRIVRVYDVYLDAGHRYGLRSGLAGDIFLMGGDPAVPSTAIRSRSQAVAATNVMSRGSVCSTYTAPRSGWYGAVIVTGWQNGEPQSRQRASVSVDIDPNSPDWVNCVRY